MQRFNVLMCRITEVTLSLSLSPFRCTHAFTPLPHTQMSVMELAQYKERRDSVRLFEERWVLRLFLADLICTPLKKGSLLCSHTSALHSHLPSYLWLSLATACRCSALASGSDLLEAGIRDSHRQVCVIALRQHKSALQVHLHPCSLLIC